MTVFLSLAWVVLLAGSYLLAIGLLKKFELY